MAAVIRCCNEGQVTIPLLHYISFNCFSFISIIWIMENCRQALLTRFLQACKMHRPKRVCIPLRELQPLMKTPG